MDILLIQPPIEDFYRTRFREYPLGLLYLAAALRDAGHKPSILDARLCKKPKRSSIPEKLVYLENYYTKSARLFLNYEHYGLGYEEMGKFVARSGAELVAINAMFTPYFNEVINVARAVKKISPQLPIVAGGHHATADPESLLRSGVVDHVIRGEGERALVEVVDQICHPCEVGSRIPVAAGFSLRKLHTLQSKADPSPAENGVATTVKVTHPKGCGYHFGNSPRIKEGNPFIQDLDTLPLPARDLISADRYLYRKKRYTMLLTSRGCPHKCSFCSVHLLGGYKHRKHSIDRVMAEIEECVERYVIRVLDLQDDNLLFDKDRIKEILEKTISHYGRYDLELMASNGLNAAHMDDELLSLMKRAGFRKLDLALGTADVPFRKDLKRPESVETYEMILEKAVKLGLLVTTYIILGIPFQPLDEMRMTVDYLKAKPTLISPSIFYNVPGMPIFEEAKKYEYLNDHIARRSSAFNNFGEDFTREDIFKLFKDVRDHNLRLSGNAIFETNSTA